MRVYGILLVVLVSWFFPVCAWAKMSFGQWRKLKRNLEKSLRQDTSKALAALEKAKNQDDPRLAEWLVRKCLFSDQPDISQKAFDLLKGYKAKETVKKIADLAQRSTKVSEKWRLVLLLGNYSSSPKISRMLANLLFHRDWQVASAAAQSLGRLSADSALSALKRALRKYRHSHPRLAFEVAQAIEKISGQKQKDYQQTYGDLFPKKIFSKTVIFALSTDSTMGEKFILPAKDKKSKPKSLTLLDFAKESLKKAISSLDSHTKFNIIAFSSRVKMWEDAPQKATAGKIRSAHRFLDRLAPSYGNDVYSALKKAFQQNDVDTIYLVVNNFTRSGYYDTPEKVKRGYKRLAQPHFVLLHTALLLREPKDLKDKVARARVEELNEGLQKLYGDITAYSFGRLEKYFYSKTQSGGLNASGSKSKKESFTISKKKGRIGYSQWRSIRKKFEQALRRPKREESLEVIEKVAAADDPRCVKLIMEKGLTHSDIRVVQASLKGLKRCRSRDSWRVILNKIKRISDERLQLLLIEVLGAYGKNVEIELKLMDLARHRSWRVKSAAIRALAQVGSGKCIAVLKSFLRRRSSHLRLAVEAADALERITGKRPANVPRILSDFLPPAVASDRVLFAISLSKEMDKKVWISSDLYKKIYPKKRAISLEKEIYIKKLELAKYFLKTILTSLPPKTRFGVVAFSGRIRFWKKGLVRASRGNIRSAKRYLDRLDVSYGEDILGAYRASVKTFKDVDTFYIFGASLPSGGTVEDRQKILEKISLENLTYFWRIHSRVFLRRAPSNASKVKKAQIEKWNKATGSFYRKLAEQNHGTFASFPGK